MRSKTKRMVIAALMAAIVCVVTMIIKIPTPMKGYINIGDAFVLLCGWLLSPGYGFLAAAIGSAAADVLSGYATYAPATFFIKGAMALVAVLCYRYLRSRKKMKRFPSRLIGGVLAEILMISGYFAFEAMLYGGAASLINIPANAIQAIVSFIIGAVLVKIFEKMNISLN